MNNNLEIIKVPRRFTYAGHLLEVNFYGLGDGEILSVASRPLIDENGKSKGIYPTQFAEQEAHNYLTENYNPKTTIETMADLLSATDEAICSLIKAGIFGEAN
jgi:hypothetical protein